LEDVPFILLKAQIVPHLHRCSNLQILDDEAMADAPALHIIAIIIGAGVAGPVLALTILSTSVLRKRYRPVIQTRDTDP
jgi:hypothetical protein